MYTGSWSQTTLITTNSFAHSATSPSFAYVSSPTLSSSLCRGRHTTLISSTTTLIAYALAAAPRLHPRPPILPDCIHFQLPDCVYLSCCSLVDDSVATAAEQRPAPSLVMPMEEFLSDTEQHCALAGDSDDELGSSPMVEKPVNTYRQLRLLNFCSNLGKGTMLQLGARLYASRQLMC